MNLGYDYHQPGTGLTLPIPHKTVVCALRPSDGELISCLEVRDTVEGMVNIGTAGRLSVSHTSIFGSYFYYGVNDQIPRRYRSPMQPIGGLTGMGPASFCEQLTLEINHVRELLSQLDTAMEIGNWDQSERLARQADMQMEALPDTIKQVREQGLVPKAQLQALGQQLQVGRRELGNLQSALSSPGRREERLLEVYGAIFDTQQIQVSCPEG